MYEQLEENRNIFLHQIINDIQKKYSLTTTQRLKIYYILNNDIITVKPSDNSVDNQNEQSIHDHFISTLVKKLFNILIEPKKIEDSLVESDFSQYIKNCMIEFYTFEYCIEHNIKYYANEEYLISLRQLINGIAIKDLTNKEIEDILFRSSIYNLFNLSDNGPKLLKEFKINHN